MAAAAVVGACLSPRVPAAPPAHPSQTPTRDGAAAQGPASRGERTLLVLGINDFHGQLDALPVPTDETPSRNVLVGGAEALAATIAELRVSHHGPTLLLDAGDFMQGTLLSNTTEGAAVADYYGVLGVDAAAIGNHEFDFGPVGPAVLARPGEDARGALKALARRAPFPLLSANIEGSAGWPNVFPTRLLTRQGVRIGLIGLTTEDTPQTTFPDNVRDLRFSPFAPLVRHHARELRQRGAQVVIVLAHAGAECRTADAASCHGAIVELAQAVGPTVVDAIVAGHTHRCVAHTIAGVPVSESCTQGVAVGRIALALSATGRVVRREVLPARIVCHQVFAESGDCEPRRPPATRAALIPSPLLVRHAAQVARVAHLLRPYRERVAQREAEELTTLSTSLVSARDRLSSLGLYAAEALRRAAGADVGIVNVGGLRNPLRAGRVTFGHVFRAFPFDNRLATVTLSGSDLEALFRVYAAQPLGGVLQAAGVQVQSRCQGGRLRIERVVGSGGRPLALRRRYRVALSDFLLAGGDGLGAVFQRVAAQDKRVDTRGVRDVLVADLRRGETLRQLAARLRAPELTQPGPCAAAISGAQPPRRPLCGI